MGVINVLIQWDTLKVDELKPTTVIVKVEIRCVPSVLNSKLTTLYSVDITILGHF